MPNGEYVGEAKAKLTLDTSEIGQNLIDAVKESQKNVDKNPVKIRLELDESTMKKQIQKDQTQLMKELQSAYNKYADFKLDDANFAKAIQVYVASGGELTREFERIAVSYKDLKDSLGDKFIPITEIEKFKDSLAEIDALKPKIDFSGIDFGKLEQLNTTLKKIYTDGYLNAEISDEEFIAYVKDFEKQGGIFTADLKEIKETYEQYADDIANMEIPKLSIFNYGDSTFQLQKLFEEIKQYANGNGINKLDNYFMDLEKSIANGDISAQNMLKTLGLLKGELAEVITAGNVHYGGITGDDITLLSQRDDGKRYNETLKLKEALEKAAEEGINVARILDIVKDKESDLFVELQETAPGKMLAQTYSPFGEEFDYVNLEALKATDEQIKKFIEDLIRLNELGIGVDFNTTNFMFDKEKGFSFIDLDLNPEKFENTEEIVVKSKRLLSDIREYYDEIEDTSKLPQLDAFENRFSEIGNSLAKSMVNGYAEGQDSHSPSKEAQRLVSDFADGVTEGSNVNKDKVHIAGETLASEFVDGYNEKLKSSKLDNESSVLVSITPFFQEPSGQLSFFDDTQKTIKTQEKIQSEIKETNDAIEGQITLEEHLKSIQLQQPRVDAINIIEESVKTNTDSWNEAIKAAEAYKDILGDVIDVTTKMHRSINSDGQNKILLSYKVVGEKGNTMTFDPKGQVLNYNNKIIDNLTKQRELEKEILKVEKERANEFQKSQQRDSSVSYSSEINWLKKIYSYKEKIARANESNNSNQIFEIPYWKSLISEYEILIEQQKNTRKEKGLQNSKLETNLLNVQNKLEQDYNAKREAYNQSLEKTISLLHEEALIEDKIRTKSSIGQELSIEDQKALIDSIEQAIEYEKSEQEYVKERNKLLTEGIKQAKEIENLQKSAEKALNSFKINKSDLLDFNGYDDKLKELQNTISSISDKNDLDIFIKNLKEIGIELDKIDKKDVQLLNFNQQLSEIKAASDGTQIYQKQIQVLESAIERYKSVDVLDESQRDTFKKAKKDVDDLIKSFNNANNTSISKLSSNMTKWLRDNTAASKEARLQVEGFVNELKDPTITQFRRNQIAEEFNKISASAEKGLSVLDQIKSRFKSLVVYLSSFASFYQIIGAFKQGFNTVRELNTALTEMYKVSDETLSSLKSYQFETFDIADKVGTTAKQIQNSTADWMRLGEAMKEASESAKVSNILLNVSEFEDINEATDALVSVSQAYKDLDKIDIVDKINNIGNNYSIATDELASGLQRSAAVLQTQGNDLNKAIALITAGNAITQNAEMTSAGVRTISLRIAGTEEAKEELAALGEDVDDFIVQTSSKTQQIIKDYTAVASNAYKGIDVLDSNGNLRDTYSILLDISKVYKEIQETDKRAGTNRANALVEVLAGKNRSNIAASILQNSDMLESVYKDAQNSSGSATEELNKYLDSIDGKMSQLENRAQEFWVTVINDNLIKNGIDLLSKLLGVITSIIDKVGSLPTLLGVGGITAFVKSFA